MNYAIMDSHRQTTRNFCRSCRFTDEISLNSLKRSRKFCRQTERQINRETSRKIDTVQSAVSSFSLSMSDLTQSHFYIEMHTIEV